MALNRVHTHEARKGEVVPRWISLVAGGDGGGEREGHDWRELVPSTAFQMCEKRGKIRDRGKEVTGDDAGARRLVRSQLVG